MPKNIKEPKVRVDAFTLYQLLLSECRYGYTRNNHLMPDAAYDHVKQYLPEILKVKPDLALHTACQICEECITLQLTEHFFDGLDDEYKSKQAGLDFVNYLLEWIHAHGSEAPASHDKYENFCPYNYDSYKAILQKTAQLRYRVYELNDFDRNAIKIRELTSVPVTMDDADQLLFGEELGGAKATVGKMLISTNEYPVRIVGEIFRIFEPVSHASRVYSIELVKQE